MTLAGLKIYARFARAAVRAASGLRGRAALQAAVDGFAAELRTWTAETRADLAMLEHLRARARRPDDVHLN